MVFFIGRLVCFFIVMAYAETTDLYGNILIEHCNIRLDKVVLNLDSWPNNNNNNNNNRIKTNELIGNVICVEQQKQNKQMLT